MNKNIPPQTLRARDACLQNAEDLLVASKAVLNEKLFNIGYHIAVVALEEIGKACLLTVSKIQEYDTGDSRYQKHTDDHVKKIFWALLDLSFSDKPITNKTMEDNNNIAHIIHDLRLKSMYVDVDGNTISVPRTMVTEDQAVNMFNLATSRLAIEKAHEFEDLDDDALELIDWFLKLKDNPDWSKIIFARTSLEKLAELNGNTRKWIYWLKEIYDKQMAENKLFAEAEINKPEPSDTEKNKEKWKIKLRLICQSHSIRQKPLNKWNDICHWIKFTYDGNAKKNDILVDVTLPNAISVNNLWWAGWGMARKLVAAMNIGTMGFIWWTSPKYVDKFYCEKIYDIENKHHIDIQRSPSLKIDWGNRAIDETDIRNIAIAFSCIPGNPDSPYIRIYDYYYRGLTFLGINDVNFQCEDNAFANFYLALKEATRLYGKIADADMRKHLSEVFGRDITEDMKNICVLGEEILNKTGRRENYDLEKVGFIKILCDTYLIKQFYQQKRHEDELGATVLDNE